MSESWLEIGDEELDAREVQRRVEKRLLDREAEGFEACPELDTDLGRSDTTVSAAREQSGSVARWLNDCDLVPAHYKIDWRVPIIGPIHAAIRRVINAEIRRYLLASLVRQSHLNRSVLRLLQELEQENARLRQDLEQLRQRLGKAGHDQGLDR